MSNDNKYRRFSIILEDENNKHNDIDTFIDNLKLEFGDINYYAILHDCDITEEGELKRKHYHIIIDLKKTKIRQQTMLNKVSYCYGSDRGNDTVGCQPCELRSMIRYLVHIDYPKKYQYSKDLIVTNDIRGLNNAFNNNVEIEGLTAQELINFIDNECVTKKDLMLKIGLNNYCRYAKAIDMLFMTKVINDTLAEKVNKN